MNSSYLADSFLPNTFCLVSVFIVIGNSFVFLSIVYDGLLRRNISNYFIASLALCDIITGLVLIPMKIYQKKSTESMSELYCEFFQTLHFFTCQNTIVHLYSISLDRYYRIKDPLKHKRFLTPRRTLAIMALLWIISFLT